MICIRIFEHDSPDYQQMLDLRYEILRKPLGLHFSPTDLVQDKHDVLIGAFMEEQLVGCCILSKQNETTVKLRQMAVDFQKQGMGIGASLLHFAETHAIENEYKTLCMHARKTAIGFYESLGYSIKGEEFKEVGIFHFYLEKHL